MLKDANGKVILPGEVLVEACVTDTIKLAVKIGGEQDSKNVHLAEWCDAQFYGVLL